MLAGPHRTSAFRESVQQTPRSACAARRAGATPTARRRPISSAPRSACESGRAGERIRAADGKPGAVRPPLLGHGLSNRRARSRGSTPPSRPDQRLAQAAPRSRLARDARGVRRSARHRARLPAAAGRSAARIRFPAHALRAGRGAGLARLDRRPGVQPRLDPVRRAVRDLALRHARRTGCRSPCSWSARSTRTWCCWNGRSGQNADCADHRRVARPRQGARAPVRRRRLEGHRHRATRAGNDRRYRRRSGSSPGKKLKGEPIDLLFCNAGISGKRGMAPGSFDFASWEEVLRVNLLGPAALAEALIENVAASERRTIAMMSSRLGSISESSGMTLPYSTSKAALNMLVKGLAATLASRKHYRRGAEPRLGAYRHGRRRRAALARGVGARAAQGDRRPEASGLGKILLARRLGDSLVKNLIAKLEVVGVREGRERVELTLADRPAARGARRALGVLDRDRAARDAARRRARHRLVPRGLAGVRAGAQAAGEPAGRGLELAATGRQRVPARGLPLRARRGLACCTPTARATG